MKSGGKSFKPAITAAYGTPNMSLSKSLECNANVVVDGWTSSRWSPIASNIITVIPAYWSTAASVINVIGGVTWVREGEGDDNISYSDHISCCSFTRRLVDISFHHQNYHRACRESSCVASTTLGSGTIAGKVLPTSIREEISSWLLFDNEPIQEDWATSWASKDDILPDSAWKRSKEYFSNRHLRSTGDNGRNYRYTIGKSQ